MPPAVGAAAVTAGGALLGGALASRSTNRATDATIRAQQEALAYAKEQDAYNRRKAEEAEALQKAQWEAREARKAEILARYGRRYTPQPYTGLAVRQPVDVRASRAPSGLAPSAFVPQTPALQAPRMTLGRIGEWPVNG